MEQGTRRPSTADELRTSESAPALPALRPIDVYNEQRRKGLLSRRKSAEEQNTLERWLEENSNASTAACTETTMCSSWTGVSGISRTSRGSSVASGPMATTKAAYLPHTRAFAVNRRKWKVKKAHDPGVLKDGLPTDNVPDELRLQTVFQKFYGFQPPGHGKLPKKMWDGVIQGERHDFVEHYLDDANAADRESFANMARALQSLQKIRHFTTSYEGQYNVEENGRLWRPPKEKPSRAKGTMKSQLPMGTIDALVNVHREKYGLDQPTMQPPSKPADVLIVGDDDMGAVSSLGDDVGSLRSEDLRAMDT